MDLNKALLSLDELMAHHIESDVEVLQEASRHILLAGGKRIRPRLLFLAYQAVGGDDLESVLPMAAALEMLHTATLAHDDINDHGTLRRNRPTLNVIWGRTFALLTGDYLFGKVYQLLAPYNPRLNTILADAVVQVVEGETLQAHAAKTGALDEGTYYTIISRKTAVLFQAAAMLGAALGDGTPAQVDLLGDYGFKIGLSFQIIDDILDLMADSGQLGKSAGLDVSQGKGVAVAMAENREDGVAVVTMTEAAEAARDPLLTFKRDLFHDNAVDKARAYAYRLVEEAVELVYTLLPGPAAEALIALARATVEREY